MSRTLDGHSPIGDIINTYDSQKQCNHLGSNVLDKYMLRQQQFWFSITDVRVGICTDSILRDGIKCAVVAQAEELKKFHNLVVLVIIPCNPILLCYINFGSHIIFKYNYS